MRRSGHLASPATTETAIAGAAIPRSAIPKLNARRCRQEVLRMRAMALSSSTAQEGLDAVNVFDRHTDTVVQGLGCHSGLLTACRQAYTLAGREGSRTARLECNPYGLGQGLTLGETNGRSIAQT